jgi:hypothetical protein
MMDFRPTLRAAREQKLWHFAVDEIHASRHAQNLVGSESKHDRAHAGTEESKPSAGKKAAQRSIRSFYFPNKLLGGIDAIPQSDAARCLRTKLTGHVEILAEDRRWRVLLVDLVGEPLLLRDELCERQYLVGCAPPQRRKQELLERFAGAIAHPRRVLGPDGFEIRHHERQISIFWFGSDGSDSRFALRDEQRRRTGVASVFDFTVEQSELRRAEVIERLSGEPLPFIQERCRRVLQRLGGVPEPTQNDFTGAESFRMYMNGLRSRHVN